MFLQLTKCFVQPKNPKETQLNKIFESNFPLGKEILIKSNKFDQYLISQKIFIKEWDIISYYGTSKSKTTVKTKR
jgi:hypothetical protein